MSASLRFIVMGEPIPKARARVVTLHGKRRSYTPASTLRFEQAVRVYAMKATAQIRWVPSKEARYRLTVRLVFKNRRRKDVSNVLKSIEDACNGVIWPDDSQIVEVVATRALSPDPVYPRAEILVEIL